MRPSTHPHARRRATDTVEKLLHAIGPTEAHGWSRAVYRPVEALITLAAATPPMIDTRPPFDLGRVFTATYPLFAADDRFHDYIRVMEHIEALDSLAHLPPDFLAANLGTEIGNNEIRFSEVPSTADPSVDAPHTESIRPEEALGWAWLDSRKAPSELAIVDLASVTDLGFG